MAPDRPTRRAALRTLAAAPVALAAIGRSAAQDRQRLSLLTGAAGGGFNQVGPLLARAVAAKVPIDLDIEATGGSNDNIRALVRGEADLGLSSLGPAYDAWHGRKPFLSGSFRTLRALVPLYETAFNVAVRRTSGIRAVSELSGRTVGTGPSGGPGETFFKGLAKGLGIAPKVSPGAPADLARRLVSGEIDAFWTGGTTPVAAFVEAQEAGDVQILGLTPQEVEALKAAFGYFASTAIPPGTYRGQAAELTTASVWNFLLATDRLPEDQAYGLSRAALAAMPEMAREMPALARTSARSALADTFLTFHPGAVRFYREAGVALPAAVTDS